MIYIDIYYSIIIYNVRYGYTVQQRVRIIEAYYGNGCSKKSVYRALRDFFGITNLPTERTILYIVYKFKETGSVKLSV